jgi:hypothetical protein
MGAAIPPWATGPGELLQHGIDLLDKDSDAKRRIALILIDNAVELIAQTYISLPKRVTGIQLSRKQREEFCAGFPSLLDGLEEHAADKIVGLNLGEFEWFHRLRNQLYHEGNGLTVEKRYVEVYAELAAKLFEALFGCPLELNSPEGTSTELIGEFFQDWIEIERKLVQVSGEDRKRSMFATVQALHRDGQLDDKQAELIRQVQGIRNELIHGEAEPEEMLRPENLKKVRQVKNFVNKLFDAVLSATTGTLP